MSASITPPTLGGGFVATCQSPRVTRYGSRTTGRYAARSSADSRPPRASMSATIALASDPVYSAAAPSRAMTS